MKCDVAIIGGGLAGLSLSIDLRKRGFSVVVIEKGNYPRHKVCGEYISMESHEYLYRLCPSLSQFSLPIITNFKLSSTGKTEFQAKLDLGGFGISRYLLEELLYKEATKLGVVFLLKCKALDIDYDKNDTTYRIKTISGDVTAKLVCNSTGRKSNFETKERETNVTGTNYVGIKYHVKIDRDPSFVEIHNFPGGYCGISGIEENKTCLCYIVNSKNLKLVDNSIIDLEKKFLYQNSNLKRIFSSAEFLFKEPLTISGINFKTKAAVNETTFYLGDSAGMIAPVTGNGMSMALRSASVFAALADQYFSNTLTKQQLKENYTRFWTKEFSGRVNLSRHFQKLSEYPFLTKMCIGLFKPFPSLANAMIKQTHGSTF